MFDSGERRQTTVPHVLDALESKPLRDQTFVDRTFKDPHRSRRYLPRIRARDPRCTATHLDRSLYKAFLFPDCAMEMGWRLYRSNARKWIEYRYTVMTAGNGGERNDSRPGPRVGDGDRFHSGNRIPMRPGGRETPSNPHRHRPETAPRSPPRRGG